MAALADIDGVPSGWQRCAISDFTRIVLGQSPSSETYNRQCDGLPFFQGKAEFGEVFPTINMHCSRPKKIAKSGATLLSIRAPVGPTNLAQQEYCIGRGLAAFHPCGEIEPKFVLYLFRNIEPLISHTGTGSTFQAIGKGSIESLEFNLPPLAEQRRIVAKIEELFSELDKGVESLKTAHRQLGVFRQSVLKHAFEGKLTAQWREENKDKLEKPGQLLARVKSERVVHYERQLQKWRTAIEEWEDSAEQASKPRKPPSPKSLAKLDESFYPRLPQLPESWKWEKLGWMTCGVEYGTAAKSSKSGTVSVLRMGNIQNARFDWSDLVYTSDDDEIAKYFLHDGDVLFNRTNSPELVGKTAIYRSELPAIFAGYLIRVNQISAVVESQYLNLFLNSEVARQYGDSVKTDGVNQSNINGAKLVNYPFPYCSVQEQREIVRILDKTMSIVDDAEAKIDAELERTVALRQAILKKAFAGHLVAQDPGDEPASVLLEKIRTERAKAGQTARRNRKAKTAA